MLSPIFIYGSVLLLVSWHFVEGLQGEKHTLVKRGAIPENCYHRCDGGCHYGLCNCNHGWTGQSVQCSVRDCSSGLYCKNGGTCVENGKDYTCVCKDGWSGKDCEHVDCSSGLYCKNGGTCVEKGMDYTCVCKDGWSGKDCEQVVCTWSGHCNDRGTCVPISTNTDYTCSNCASGWTGKSCHLIDCSSKVYCNNGGTCMGDVNGGTDYRCICEEGWTGKDCQLINCSSPIRCLNGGQCHLQNDGKKFNCTCADGYLGDNCQIDMCSPYKIADIVFIIDVSVSQDGATFNEQKNFVKYFIAQFPLGRDHFQFSLVLYASEPHAVFNLRNTYDNNTIIDAVDNATLHVGKRGATFTGKVLAFVKDHSFATTNGGRADVDRYVILLTDGMSSAPLDTANQTKLLRLSYPNIRIISIGSGEFVFHTELLDISAYHLNVYPLRGNDSVRKVQKSTMYGCERCTTAYSDVVLAFDVSSFNYGQLDTMLKTAEVLISNLHTDVNQTRVGLFKYESIAEEVFKFGKYTTSNEMISDMNKHIQKKETCMKDGHCSSRDLSALLQDISDEFQMHSDKSRRKAVVIFSQFIFDNYIAERIQNLKENGVIVIIVGEGLDANMDRMFQLSTNPFFTFIIGKELNTPIDVILALMSTLEYDICFDQ
ncbi:hypothetical protein DPMN_084700 [Dreissena polymorpha]|uniref:Uncharacterized protein n=1 Tax=Dreissena polymorpha TaxID=45954 RepID=A0A9D4BIR6_DREPO|nr:hypothetical protein DPMN_084700 [Dreissena polymorpha]